MADIKNMNKVYYISYGSNLLSERFITYITGGYVKGNTKNHVGSRDKSLPKNKIHLKLRGTIIMSGHSKNWGGGYAFYNPNIKMDTVLASGYLITWQQFEDVTAQENGLNPGDITIDLSQIIKKGSILIERGQYDKIIFLGYYDGVPMLTFTSSTVDELTKSIASKAYIDVIEDGIRETFKSNITESEITAYINKINSR